MKVSWLILTYNRAEKVQRSVTWNMTHAGEAWDELVWVDNGSTDGVRGVMQAFSPDVSVLNPKNLGVAVGYNQALQAGTSDFLVITGCDMLMPKGWLKTMKDCFRRIPRTGIACIYSGPLHQLKERLRGPEKGEVHAGLRIVHSMPIGRRMLSRGLLEEVGYFHEGFGLYGHDDVFWGHRAEKVCKQKGLLFYSLPDHTAVHLGTEGVVGWDGKDERAYHAFKQKEVVDPKKAALMGQLSSQGWPIFNPPPLGSRGETIIRRSK